MKTLRHRAVLTAGVALPLALTASPVFAGAWPQDEGRTQIIFASTLTDASRRFDRKGRPLSADRFTKQEASVRAQYGLTESVTLLAGAKLQHLAEQSAEQITRSGSGAVQVGARLRVWSHGPTIVSVQGWVQGGGERSLPGHLRALDAPAEADLRIKIGHSFAIASVPAFMDAQMAYRWRGGRHADELRLDATLGVRPVPYLLVMLQSFNTFAITRDDRFGGGRLRQHKLQASVVYDLTERWSLQVGGFASIAGRETVRERGGLVALWWKL
jgi:protein XagA